MASPLTMSTPPSSNDLPGLPLELWLHIFENLGPLENLLSLISASPAAFVNFQGGKSHILRPFVDNINDQIDPDTIATLFSSSKEWDQNLSAVIKLTNSFRKIDSAACYYKGIRGLPVPLDSQPEAPGSEIKKFLVTLMYETILLDLFTYRDGTLFNPRTSILNSAAWEAWEAWEASKPTLENVDLSCWRYSSDQSCTLVSNDRWAVFVAVVTVANLYGRKEDAERGYNRLMPVELCGDTVIDDLANWDQLYSFTAETLD
ncbi:uncharacterized protein FPRN_02100 [Fusarium proliferatum]|nr:uncharacterized protein FPRN_02100 [Fusarium proliferatum]